MSDITSKIAAEHRWLATHCSCGYPIGQVKLGLADQVDHYIRHVAEVTEAAVRARIAADIEDKRAGAANAAIRHREDGEEQAAWEAAMSAHAYAVAARIAEGGTS